MFMVYSCWWFVKWDLALAAVTVTGTRDTEVDDASSFIAPAAAGGLYAVAHTAAHSPARAKCRAHAAILRAPLARTD